MATSTGGEAPTYLRSRGPLWGSLALLLAMQALAAAGGAAVAYLVAGPRLAKDYYSAHATVKATWVLLVPALSAGAAAGLLLGSGLGALVIWRHHRALRAVLAEVDGVLRRAGAGRIPPPASAAAVRRGGPAEDAAAALVPLRARVAELQRLSRELQHPVLELTYRAAGTADVPPRDLRPLAGALDQTSRELAQTLSWFED